MHELVEALEQVNRAMYGLMKLVKSLPVEADGLVGILWRGVDTLRMHITQWIEDRRHLRADVSKYDANKQWEEIYQRLNSLLGMDNWKGFTEICTQEWREDLFQRIRVFVGHPIKGSGQQQVVFVEEEDKEVDRGLQEMYMERYRDL